MSAFIAPQSDRSAPGVNDFLLLWGSLLDWQKAQFLSAWGIDRGVEYPVSVLLAEASAVELLVEARNLFAATAASPAARHVHLEWPPRGRLAEIWRDMHAEG